MKRCTPLLITFVLLVLNGTVAVAQAQNRVLSEYFSREVKNIPLTPRPKAKVVPSTDAIDLYEKGYVRIGSWSLTWIANATEVKRGTLEVSAELSRALGDRAAAVGGDLVEIRSVTEHDYEDSPIKILAPVWRFEPLLASEIVSAFKGDTGATNRVTAMGLKIPPNPLADEIFLGDLANVRKLLDRGYSPNVLCSDPAAGESSGKRATPLHWAVSHKKTEIVRLLLDRAADPNRGVPDVEGGTPLHWAARDANSEMAQLLIAHRADVNSRATEDQKTPLSVATASIESVTSALFPTRPADYLALVKLLLGHGADVAAYDKEGRTPLHHAAVHNAQIVRALLAAGAPINAPAKDGETPLMASIRGLRTDYDIGPMRALLEAGADASLRDRQGWNALDHAQDDLKFAKRHHDSAPGLQEAVNTLRAVIASGGKYTPPPTAASSEKFLANSPSPPVVKAPAIPVTAAASLPGEWQQYSYAGDGFSIAAPLKPDLQIVSQGNVETHNYKITLGTRSLLLSVTDTKQGAKLEPKRALPALRDAFTKDLNVKVTSEREIKLAGYPGIEFEAQGTEKNVRSRAYAVKGTLFHLVSIAPAGLVFAPQTDRVFDSLTLLH